MQIGTIKSINTEDNQLTAIVQDGAGVEEEVVVYSAPGVQEYPLVGDTVVYDDAGNDNVLVAVFRQSEQGEVSSGETIVYSRNAGGSIAGSIKLSASGTITMNGGTDFAVAFTDLNTAITSLVAQVNAFIAVYNAHVVLPVNDNTKVGVPLVVSLDPARVNDVRLP